MPKTDHEKPYAAGSPLAWAVAGWALASAIWWIFRLEPRLCTAELAELVRALG